GSLRPYPPHNATGVAPTIRSLPGAETCRGPSDSGCMSLTSPTSVRRPIKHTHVSRARRTESLVNLSDAGRRPLPSLRRAQPPPQLTRLPRAATGDTIGDGAALPAIQEGSLLQHLRGSLSASDKPKGSPVTVASLRQLGSASSVRRGLLALVDSGAGAGGSFALTILLANALSREAYGAFVLAYSVYILALGLHTALILEPFSVFGAGMNLRAFRAYAAQVAGGHLVWIIGTAALLLL